MVESLLWAHSGNEAGRRHALVDHLRGTAALARRFTSVFAAEGLGWLLGLCHDVGKASCAWQEGLIRAEAADGRSRVGVGHKSLGVSILDPLVGWAALAVDGHHGGLRSPAAVRAQCGVSPTKIVTATSRLGWP